nr:MAG TPA: hypothetical protein [Caudoviricetes sp.]
MRLIRFDRKRCRMQRIQNVFRELYLTERELKLD